MKTDTVEKGILSMPPIGTALPDEAFNPSLMNRAERRKFFKQTKVKVVAMNKPAVKTKDK